MDKQFAEAYVKATGGQKLRLDVLDSTTGEITQPCLDYPFAIVGRSASADLFLNHWQVSRRHIYFQVLDENVFWMDMASRTGVQVNGIAETVGWLTHGDVLSLGAFEIRLSPNTSNTVSSAKPVVNPLMNDSSSEEFPGVQLELVGEHRKLPMWSIQPWLTLIGRSARCRVRIKTSDVSGFHCALIQTRVGLWVVDLLGRGTKINQVATRFARLEADDELYIGKQKIRVLYDAQLPKLFEEVEWVETAGVPALIATRIPPMEEPGKLLTRLVAGRSPEQVEFAQALLVPLVQQFSQIQQEMVDQFQQTMMNMFNEFGSLYQEQMTDFKKELAEIRQLTVELQELQAASAVVKATLVDTETDVSSAIPAIVTPTIPKQKTQTAGQAAPIKKPASSGMATSVDIHAMLTMRIAAIQTERQGRLQRIMQMILGESKG